MIISAAFLPTAAEVKTLSEISGRRVLNAPDQAPRIEKAYIQKCGGSYLALEWNYSDVEPRFEVFHLSVGENVELPSSASQETAIPDYDAVALAVRCEWVRPTAPDQVGQGDEYIEEVGRSEQVPRSATAVAKYVYGLLFMSSGKPVFAVHISESELDSLAFAATDEELSRIVACCDVESVEK